MISGEWRFAALGAVALALGLSAGRIVDRAGGPEAATAGTFKAEQLAKGQFRTLPDSVELELPDGTRTTAGALRSRTRQRMQASRAKAHETAFQAPAEFAARRARFLEAQQTKIRTQNDQAWAEFTHRSGNTGRGGLAQREVIHQEALQLLEHAKTASPDEKVQIEQRAGQLLRQLEQTGH
jgi:hypothetical protein